MRDAGGECVHGNDFRSLVEQNVLNVSNAQAGNQSLSVTGLVEVSKVTNRPLHLPW